MSKYPLWLLILLLALSACSRTEPKLELASTELSLNSDYSEARFTFRNVGDVGSTLEWRVQSDGPRVSTSPSEGSVSHLEQASFSVQIDRTGLAVGEVLRATLQLDSNGGSETLTVIYQNEPGSEPETPEFYCYPDASRNNALAHTSSGAPLENYVPGQLLVRYRDDADSLRPLETRARALEREYGLTTLDANLQYADLVALPAGQSVEEALQALNADPRVAYAEPNYYLYAQATPNDTFLEEQWNLLNFGLPQAWDIETGGSNVTVAVLDSGVDLSHEDLRGKLVQGCDFYDQDNDPNPGLPKTTADQTHGTHVAGIAAATGDNGAGVAGVAYTGVKVLPVKVFDDAGRVARTDVVAKAIRWAAGLDVDGVRRNPNPADIINLSLGGNIRDPDTDEPINIPTLDEAIRDARRAGVLTVVAAGNDNEGAEGDGIFAPANAPDALAVGSVNIDYERSSFSVYNTSGRTVDLMAPGGLGPSDCGLVVSTVAAESGSGDYGCQAGTSMAAPFVAGVAALLWSQHPDWSADQVEAQLLSATLFDSSFMSESEYGAGVLCADQALDAATRCGN